MTPKSIRLPFGGGRIVIFPDDVGEAILPARLMFSGWLEATHLDPHGHLIDQYDLGSGLVTDDGVEYLVDHWVVGTLTLNDMKYHDSGTGTVAAAVTDADLGTPAGPSTRATGSLAEVSANQVRTVGTISYTSSLAITEWGLFHDSTRGATDYMWDRRVFTAINVQNGDSIEFTYTLTVNSGG